jgi:hypothetical protein
MFIMGNLNGDLNPRTLIGTATSGQRGRNGGREIPLLERKLWTEFLACSSCEKTSVRSMFLNCAHFFHVICMHAYAGHF